MSQLFLTLVESTNPQKGRKTIEVVKHILSMPVLTEHLQKLAVIKMVCHQLQRRGCNFSWEILTDNILKYSKIASGLFLTNVNRLTVLSANSNGLKDLQDLTKVSLRICKKRQLKYVTSNLTQNS